MLKNAREVVAIDPDEESLREARVRAAESRSQVRFLPPGDIRHVEGTFDIICYNFSLHYIVDSYEESLAAIQRVLAPGGLLIGIVPEKARAEMLTNGKPWLDFHRDSSCKMGLDFFMFGHDHDIEWLKPVAACNAKTQFILSGTSEQPRAFGSATRNATHYQKDNVLAFFWFEFRENDMTGAAYLVDRDTLKPITNPDGSLKADFEQTMARTP